MPFWCLPINIRAGSPNSHPSRLHHAIRINDQRNMIETFGTALALVPLAVLSARNGRLFADVFEFYFREKLDRTGQTPWARVMPILVTLPLRLIFPGVWSQWQFIEEVVLPGDDATVEQFKLSYLSDCNMTSVAVSSRSSPSAPQKFIQFYFKFQL